jgi:hypothetical protein
MGEREGQRHEHERESGNDARARIQGHPHSVAYRRASALPAIVALTAEQVLKCLEVPAHGIDVAHKRCEVLLRAIEVAS